MLRLIALGNVELSRIDEVFKLKKKTFAIHYVEYELLIAPHKS